MRTILKVINWNLCYFHWFKVGRLNVFLTSWTRKLISLLFLLVSGYGKCSSVGSSSSCSCSGTNPRLQRTVGRLLSFDWQDWRSGSHRSPGQVEAGKKILYLFFVPFFPPSIVRIWYSRVIITKWSCSHPSFCVLNGKCCRVIGMPFCLTDNIVIS